MDSKKAETKKLSMTNTKQEMLDAYHAVLKQVQEKDEVELKPEKKLEEKKQKEAVQVALALLVGRSVAGDSRPEAGDQ